MPLWDYIRALKRERERERERQTDKQRERERERDRDREMWDKNNTISGIERETVRTAKSRGSARERERER
jgi:hypothetical protein